ncbi:MAG: putative LPS assembly protein LptD, partial [Saprospiraceae bacterium]
LLPNKQEDLQTNIKKSNDGLDDIIDYGAVDSSYIDVKVNQIHLFGEAYIKYKSYNLKAGYIIFDFDKNEASAFELEMPSGRKYQKPDFDDGTNKFTSSGLKFNFKTNKGIIYGARTQEGEFAIHGARTKFISKDSDSTHIDDHIYNKDALITTCDADHPHFGIRARKLKVIPNKLAIIGLSQIEIMGIPTPLILPFGFFPLVEGRSSGIIFPDNFEYNEELGIGFREIGYYFPINDYMDLRVTGDIYTRGTHRINISSKYKKRYKHSGNIQLKYANNIGESSKDGSPTSNKAISIKITHNQDPKAHPYQSIGGTINLSTNRYDQTNSTAYEDVVNNKISSNFFYKHSMPGTPFSFSTAFTHFQDTKTREVKVTLPDAKLRMNTIYPFKNNKGGKESWFEKINVSYDAKLKNFVSATDTTLFTNETLEKLQTGFSHNARTSVGFNILKYFNFNTSAKFEQFLYTRTKQKELDPTLVLDSVVIGKDQEGNNIIAFDTTYGKVNEEFINGLASVELFSLNAGISTKLFATKKFSKGWLRGVRHTVTPTIGFTYSPDSKSKYERDVLLSSNPNQIDEVQEYNPYNGGVFNPSLRSKQMAITYGIKNYFEGKYYSKSDSTVKKFKLFRSIDLSGTYNFAADSLKFSPLSIRGNTSFFKGVTNINFNARYNFYKKDAKGRLINKLVWDEDKRPLDFDNFSITITNGFTVGKILDFFSNKKKKTNSNNNQRNNQSNNKEISTQSLGDFFRDFRFNHSFRYEIDRQNNGIDTAFVRTHTVGVSGRVKLSNKWDLNVRNISYNLKDNKFVYPQFSLSRDLHCWAMQFSWTPALEVYSFSIGVTSSSLSFLKYDYGERNSGQLLGRPR